jgi:hypothetical protein
MNGRPAEHRKHQEERLRRQKMVAVDSEGLRSQMMVHIMLSPWGLRPSRAIENKKADVVAHLEMVHHVGLFFDELPGRARLPFI